MARWLVELVQRIGLVQFIHGRAGLHERAYLIRVFLTPAKISKKWGGLYLHIFTRGDADRDPHDHPWDFWTLPFKSYFERVTQASGKETTRYVCRWRVHPRRAEHTHRVLDTKGPLPLVTLVWHAPKRRPWGFWVGPDSPALPYASELRRRGDLRWVHWHDYVYKAPL